MEDDDDMVLVIVGDENQPLAMPIKEEPVDIQDTQLNVESIIQTAESLGQFIAIDSKEDDQYTDCEYLDLNFDDKKDRGKPDLQKICMQRPKIETKIKKEDPVVKSHTSPLALKSTKSKSTTQTSYIAQLRKNFPKMRKDEDFLISSLVEAMRSTKPPAPPPNFYRDVYGTFVCVYCKAANETLPAASRHYQSRHGVRYLACFACGRDYRCTTMLYKHEKRCPAPDARLMLKARGRYLGRKGRSRPYLTLDKFDPTNHKNNRKYCSQCPDSFIHMEALRAHENIHSGSRPFQCDRCPASYTSKLVLKRHLKGHTDEVVICDTCGRSFKEKNTLIMHMNTHLPQRKYPCDRCERRFAQKSTLRTHINRDHLNLPLPFACAVCPKRFPRMSNLKAHMHSCHGLTVMTRRGFFRALPNLSENTLKNATLVFNENSTLSVSDLNHDDKHAQQEDLSILGDFTDTEIEDDESDKLNTRGSDTKVIIEEVPSENADYTEIIAEIELKEEDDCDQTEQTDASTSNIQDILSEIKDESYEDIDQNTETTDAVQSLQETILETLSSVGMNINDSSVKDTLAGDLAFITENGEANIITEKAFIEAHTISSMIVESITGAINIKNLADKNKVALKIDNRTDTIAKPKCNKQKVPVETRSVAMTRRALKTQDNTKT